MTVSGKASLESAWSTPVYVCVNIYLRNSIMFRTRLLWSTPSKIMTTRPQFWKRLSTFNKRGTSSVILNYHLSTIDSISHRTESDKNILLTIAKSIWFSLPMTAIRRFRYCPLV